jgi:adenylate kinase
MNKYLIIGPPGAGKSTQAHRLCDSYGFVRISVGDIFRWNIKNRTKLAAKLQRYIDSGRLVPDEIVEDVVKSRLQQHDWNFGFVLDGYPASRAQAEFFLESYDVDGVVLLEVPIEMAAERLAKFRVCVKCGLDYGLIFHRASGERICEVCGGDLVQRSADSPQVVTDRLREYNQKTLPVIDVFRHRELVVAVDGTQTPEQIHAEIINELGLAPFKPVI